MQSFCFATVCPETQKYVYQNGKKCCAYNFDKDAAEITIDSTSCLNDEFVPCPGGICSSGIYSISY